MHLLLTDKTDGVKTHPISLLLLLSLLLPKLNYFERPEERREKKYFPLVEERDRYTQASTQQHDTRYYYSLPLLFVLLPICVVDCSALMSN